MPSRLISPPAAEPISLEDAKLHLRVSVTDDDSLITSLITAAREHAEVICRRAFISQQWLMTGDRFPSPMVGKLTEFWTGQQWGLAGLGGVSQFLPTDRTGYGIVLPISSLRSVDSITYIDTGGVQQTLDPSTYLVDLNDPARIMPAYGVVWPNTRQQINAVSVTYTVGYGTAAASVPEGIKAWMKLRIGSLYEHRESFVAMERGKLEALPFVDYLLDPYRIYTV